MDVKELAGLVPSPCYVIDKGLLRQNVDVLSSVRNRSGCKVLLALKAFSAWGVFDVIRDGLDGTSSSSLLEARLGKEEFGGEVHMCSPGYCENEIEQIAAIADHVVINSISQWENIGKRVAALNDKVKFALRINPEHSEVEVELYDPCSAASRLGVRCADMPAELDERISGLHFHTLCEKGADALERTLFAVEQKFCKYLERADWVNFGGGHHVTRKDYDVDLLCRLIEEFKKRYNVEVYIEPGEAVALNAGYLVSTVVDIVEAGGKIAILDTSAAAHMPDVLEMPYRPPVIGSGEKGEKKYDYQLTGRSCLAGDVIGNYSFDEPLEIGDRVIFGDMAHYTMVKNTMFNGLKLPAIAVYEPGENKVKVLREFGYDDFKKHLG